MKVIPVRPSKTLVERIGNQFPGPEISQFAQELDITYSVAEVWPKPPPFSDLHVFVTFPGAAGSPALIREGECFFICLFTLASSGYLTSLLPEGNKSVEYKDIFINVKRWGAFEGSDVERNGLKIYVNGTVPDFVAEFERRLDEKPGLAPDVCCSLDHSFDADALMG